MKQKGLQTYLFSTVGVVVIAIVLVLVNWIAARAKVRVDLTAERAYTLSDGTRNILSKLDTPLQIRFYCSRSENRLPVFFQAYAQRVEDLLEEYRERSKGQIEIIKLDPEPGSEAEDSAKLDNIAGMQLGPMSEPFYLGLSVSMLDQKESIALADAPDRLSRREQLLEYDLSRAISRVMSQQKPTIGLMTTLPLSGQMSPQMMRGGRGTPPSFLYTELKRTFDVATVETTVEKIPDNIKVLLVVHPKGLSDATNYALDQFVLRGGKLLAFLDPLAVLDPQSAGGPMGGGGPSSSSLDKLLKAWGLTFDSTKLVADSTYTTQGRDGRHPAVLSLTDKAVDPNDVLTSNTDNLLFLFAGAFTGEPAAGLKQTVLIKSSKDSQLVDPMMAQMGGQQLMRDFKPSGVEYSLALRLEGKFKSAFPEGKPKAAEPKPGEPPAADKKPEAPAEAGLKESAVDGAVLLVGDTDFLQDQYSVQIFDFGNQRVPQILNGNIAFAQSAVEQFAGDSNLIAIRSRASRDRPFTVVKKMQADAEARYQSTINDIIAARTETQTKLSELQRSNPGQKGQRLILSPEQKLEIANYEKKSAELNKQLRKEEKNLNAEVNSLGTTIKWFNIVGMAIVVILTGIILAIFRRRQQAAV